MIGDDENNIYMYRCIYINPLKKEAFVDNDFDAVRISDRSYQL